MVEPQVADPEQPEPEMADPTSIIDPKLMHAIVADAPAPGKDFSFRSGNSYEGEVAGSTTMHGQGMYTWSSTGVTYTGGFVSNTITGNGTYAWPDGSAYEGEVYAGLRHGVGIFTGPGGYPRYEGQWQAGQRHGKGKLEYKQGGDVYDGDWEDDMRHGQGTLTHASGNKYVGGWSGDVKNGNGVFDWAERRERYSGEWKDGVPHGQGEHIWLRLQRDAAPFQLRECYTGAWCEGRREGQGTFFFANGSRYVGEWVDNQKHGDGLLSFEDGSVYQGPFVNDRMSDGRLRPHTELFSYIDLTKVVSNEELASVSSALRAALIRHNTAIKKSYRDFAAWQCPAQDAFELSLRQFWTFATSAAIVTPELMTASLDRIVMRGTPPGTHPLPPALELARQVANGGGPVYHRGGEHDGKRTLLLRDFVQGLVEIAAVRLRSGLVTVPGKEATSPVPPLVHSLLELIERSILRKQAQGGASAEEGAGETADDAEADGGEAALDADSSSRLELIYAHYAITEPTPRWKRGNAEPTMTVRSYVRCLTDASLLPAESNVPALLSSTLPAYFFPLPPAPPPEAEVLALESSPQEDFLSYPEAAITEEGADLSEPPAQAEGEGPPAEEAPAAAEGEGEEAGPKEPTAEEIAAQAEAEAEALERLEGTLTLELIYPEFEEAMIAFCRLHGPEAPWAPPPPPPEEVEGEEGEAGEAEVPVNAKEAAAEDASAEEEEAPAPAPAPEPAAPLPPPSPTATLRDVVLPAIGQHLLATHQQMASVAD